MHLNHGPICSTTFLDDKLLWVAHHLHTGDRSNSSTNYEKKKKKIWNMQVVCLDLFIISMQVKGPISAEHFLMWKHMEVGVVCPTCSYTVGCCFGSLWLVCPTCVYVIIVARNIFSKRKLTFFLKLFFVTILILRWEIFVEIS